MTKQRSNSVNNKPTRSYVRKLLRQFFPIEQDFTAFCIDYFFHKVATKFASGQNRVDKENLLLTAVRPEKIIMALQRATLDESSKILAAGTTISDRYILQRQLGQGGFAVVWLAIDKKTNQSVAIKLSRNLALLQRVQIGAEAMSKLSHKHIVKVLEHIQKFGDWHYFAMEYMAGGDFHEAVCRGRFHWYEAIDIILKIGQALEFAHENNYIHRDVKPSNILLDELGSPKLSDFDLVWTKDKNFETVVGEVLGTKFYSSPEQKHDSTKIDHRSDIYSLALTAVFALYQKPIQTQGFLWDPRPFLKFNVHAPEKIKSVLEKALSLLPDHRHSNMKIFCDELRLNLDIENKCISPRSGAIREAILSPKTIGNLGTDNTRPQVKQSLLDPATHASLTVATPSNIVVPRTPEGTVASARTPLSQAAVAMPSNLVPPRVPATAAASARTPLSQAAVAMPSNLVPPRVPATAAASATTPLPQVAAAMPSNLVPPRVPATAAASATVSSWQSAAATPSNSIPPPVPATAVVSATVSPPQAAAAVPANSIPPRLPATAAVPANAVPSMLPAVTLSAVSNKSGARIVKNEPMVVQHVDLVFEPTVISLQQENDSYTTSVLSGEDKLTPKNTIQMPEIAYTDPYAATVIIGDHSSNRWRMLIVLALLLLATGSMLGFHNIMPSSHNIAIVNDMAESVAAQDLLDDLAQHRSDLTQYKNPIISRPPLKPKNTVIGTELVKQNRDSLTSDAIGSPREDLYFKRLDMRAKFSGNLTESQTLPSSILSRANTEVQDAATLLCDQAEINDDIFYVIEIKIYDSGLIDSNFTISEKNNMKPDNDFSLKKCIANIVNHLRYPSFKEGTSQTIKYGIHILHKS